ncbi:hypothetical protein [Sinorhizobium meliloti]|uniref:AbiJ-related protein n=1 Tax=Rhizobium meliloti TaxID=382 RepID=UPI001360B326
MCGQQDLVALLGRLFPIQNITAEIFSGRSLASDIEKHMARNPGDRDVEYLFEQIAALKCSRDRFGRLLEATPHPLGHRGCDQIELADTLNHVLRRDGYVLNIGGEKSGYPIYRLQPMSRGPAGSPKNLIFAFNGPSRSSASAMQSTTTSLSFRCNKLPHLRKARRRRRRCRSNPLRTSLASDAERNLFDT